MWLAFQTDSKLVVGPHRGELYDIQTGKRVWNTRDATECKTIMLQPANVEWDIVNVTPSSVTLKRKHIEIYRNWPTSELTLCPAENDSIPLWAWGAVAVIAAPVLVSAIGSAAGLTGAAATTYGLARLGGSMKTGISVLMGAGVGLGMWAAQSSRR